MQLKGAAWTSCRRDQRADDREEYSHVIAEYEHPFRTPVTIMFLLQGVLATAHQFRAGMRSLFRMKPFPTRY